MNLPPFTDDDRAFIRGILNCPADLTGWLAYADWLDEHDAPDRAEFLRLQVRHGQPTEPHDGRDEAQARLVELRSRLDPDWLAVFGRPKIANCRTWHVFECPEQWENLDPTQEYGVRHCSQCDKPVYYCHDIDTTREHVQRGDYVALSPGVRPGPLDLYYEGPESLEGRLAEALAKRRELPRSPVPHPDPNPNPVPAARPWWKFW